MTEEQKIQYQASLKHADVEEPIDLWFYRPLGFRLALLGARLGWTPNFISVISIFLGVGCGLLCLPDDWRLNLLGMALLVLADICDSADGQLARLTRQFSRLGRILDGACGDIWFVTIYVCICLRLTPEWGIWIWVLASCSGFSHRLQAAMADYYRTFHLFIVKGRAASEHDDAAAMRAEFKRISFSKEPLYKVFMWFYCTYTTEQERRTPQLQQLRKRIADMGETLDAQFCAAFRERSKPLMKYCNILSFNCRAITLFISLMVGMPWIYFVVELTVGNALMFYLTTTHERICKEMA